MILQNAMGKKKLLRETVQKKQVTFWGMQIRMAFDFSPATLDAGRQWNNVFEILRENNFDH